MLESWIISKLEPLKNLPVIIIQDEQRLLQLVAMSIDTWSNEHGYTVLLCSGNLSLRERYEEIRNVPKVRVMLFDFSRNGSLFYPDLQARAGRQGQLTLTLRDFLVEQTQDTAWPQLVNDEKLVDLLLEDIDALLQAYQHLRQVDAQRFSDSDLYKIALGAALKINPFKKLTPHEIRRLCIEQHAQLENLKNRLPDEVMDLLYKAIASAPKPFCWLLERDARQVMRAFTLAAILRQHQLDYQLLIANIDPLLYDYKEIEASFLDQAIQDQLVADPERVLEDVRAVEDGLRQNPAALALVLRDQLHIDDRQQALQVIQNERLSNLFRCLALVSLLIDLVLSIQNGSTENITFHQNVIKVIRAQEVDTTLMALRRPSEQWLAISSTYQRALDMLSLNVRLTKIVKQLKVTEASELDFPLFEHAWNEERLNRLDFYGSDLERMLRVGDILPVTVKVLWKDMVKRWDTARQSFQLTRTAIENNLNTLNDRFQDFYRIHYTKWLTRDDIPLIFTHQFLARLLKPYWNPQSGSKAVIMVFDGLRTDAWDEFLRPIIEERYELIHSQAGSALLPTETELSRKAISAGKLPQDFPKQNVGENVLLASWCKENMGFTPQFQVLRNNETDAAGIAVIYDSPQIEYIVFNFTDANLHHNQNELAMIYRNVVSQIVQQDVRSVLRDIPENATLFITSDHGFTPMPQKTISIPNEIAADMHDIKYRNARVVQKLSGADVEKTLAFDVRVMGIPKHSPSVRDTPINYILFPRAGYIFKRAYGAHNPDKYSHGGLSLAECLVPMAVFAARKTVQRLLSIDVVRQVGSAREGDVLELEITLQAAQLLLPDLPITLSFNREEIPMRKEIFSGTGKIISVRWTPQQREATQEERRMGEQILPITVVLTYYEGEQLVRTSKTIDARIKLDTIRLKRRLDSKLDLMMGKLPKELKV